MRAMARQMPDQPGIHGTESEFTALGARSRAWKIIQQPGDLGTAEIRIDNETGALAYQTLGTDAPEFVAQRRSAAVLPDNRVMEWFTALAVPHDGGFALIGDADGHQVF